MVHPLVRYHQRALHLPQMGDRILCQYGEAVGGDHIRYAVVDLRVYVVGAPGQHNAPASMLLHPFKRFLTFFLHIPAGG